MGLQVTGHAAALVALVHAHHRLQGLEELRHRDRVVPAAGEGADANAIRFRFIVPGVVDLALLHQAHAAHHGSLGGIVAGGATGLLCGDDRPKRGQQDRQALALGLFHTAQDVLLGDVGDLVGQHAGHLVLTTGCKHQARVHADVAPGAKR